MVFVKFQPLLQWPEVFRPGSGGEIHGLLSHFPGLVETAGLRAGHAQRVERERLGPVTQIIRPDGILAGGVAIANLRFFVGGQHAGKEDEDLQIVRLKAQSLAEFAHSLGIPPLFEQRLASEIGRPPARRVQSRRRGIMFHRLVKPAKLNEQGTEVVLQSRVPGINPHGFRNSASASLVWPESASKLARKSCDGTSAGYRRSAS
jgi:hypothetical protein